jgi:hypothetical protein
MNCPELEELLSGGLGMERRPVTAPGRALERLAAQAGTIARANEKLANYHQRRRQTLTQIAS